MGPQPAARTTADANGPKHLQSTITRSKFDQLTADLVERTMGPVKQAMGDAKVSANDIDEVILVGGSTRIPAVQSGLPVLDNLDLALSHADADPPAIIKGFGRCVTRPWLCWRV